MKTVSLGRIEYNTSLHAIVGVRTTNGAWTAVSMLSTITTSNKPSATTIAIITLLVGIAFQILFELASLLSY